MGRCNGPFITADRHVGPGMTREDIDTALHVIARLGLSVDDLLVESNRRGPIPTFRQYIAQVSASVPKTILDNYGPSWKVLERLWGDRLITDPSYTEIQQLVSEHQVRAAATKRSNSRGGRGAAATMVSAVRRLYRHAEHDRLIHPLDNPAAKCPNRASRPVHACLVPRAGSRPRAHRLDNRQRPGARRIDSTTVHRNSLSPRRYRSPDRRGPQRRGLFGSTP